MRYALSVVLVLALGLAGCGGTVVEGFDFGDLFSDVAASPVKIQNKTGVDIVLFREVIENSRVLGGVPNNATFGIKYIDGYYLLKAVTKDDLDANQHDPSRCKVIATAFLYVDNKSWTTNVITKADPGPGKVVLENKSSRYVEIKSDSFYGPTLTYLTPGETRTQYLPYDDYDLFPCYVHIQEMGGKVIGTTRKFKQDAAGSISLYQGAKVDTITIGEDTSTVDKDIYLYIKNNSNKGGRFAIQTTIYKSTIDREVINNEGGVQIYRFASTSRTFGANTIHLKDTMGYESPKLTTEFTLTAGQDGYLVYSGAFDGGTWTLCSSKSEFEAY